MSRRRFEWRFRQRRISLADRTLVLAVLQIAPEIQTSGMDPMDGDRAFATALEMEENGADVILVSPEALITGSKRVEDTEEIRRMVPVLKRLRNQLAIPYGVITDKTPVAERAFELGAEVIFDQSGLSHDPLMPKLVVQHDAGLIVSQMRSSSSEAWGKLPPITNPIPGLLQDLDASLGKARRSGINPHSLVADTGLGFGKRKEQCIETIADLGALDRLEVPMSTGYGELPEVATATAAAMRGCHMVRATHVKEVRQALDLVDALNASVAARVAALADKPDSNVSREPRRRF